MKWQHRISQACACHCSGSDRREAVFRGQDEGPQAVQTAAQSSRCKRTTKLQMAAFHHLKQSRAQMVCQSKEEQPLQFQDMIVGKEQRITIKLIEAESLRPIRSHPRDQRDRAGQTTLEERALEIAPNQIKAPFEIAGLGHTIGQSGDVTHLNNDGCDCSSSSSSSSSGGGGGGGGGGGEEREQYVTEPAPT